MESTDHILSSVEDGVLTLRLNRPEKLNALTQDMYAGLNAGLDQATASDDVGAVLIAANGDNFSAGNDLKDFMALAMSFGQEGGANPMEMPVVQFISWLVKFEKPLFVAVQGQAVGIGLTLTLHADFVFLADTAVLTAPFVNLGLVPEAGSSKLLPQRIGAARASEVLIAGKPVDAKRALEWGLANHIYSVDELQELAYAEAKSLAAKPRDAVRLSKQLMRSDKEALLAHINQELEILFFGRLQSDEAKAAFAAFLDR